MTGRPDRPTDERTTAVCKECRELYWAHEGHPECLTAEYMAELERMVSEYAEYEETLDPSERQ